MVKVEVMKEYAAEGQTILTLTPDFEDIGFIEPVAPKAGEERYTEAFHTEDVEKRIVSIYEKMKSHMLRLDQNIMVNPQKYYISLRKNRNFAFLELRRKKMNVVVMLPYETGEQLIKKHRVKQLSEGIQRFYNGPCFGVSVENEDVLDEVLKALEEAYHQQNR